MTSFQCITTDSRTKLEEGSVSVDGLLGTEAHAIVKHLAELLAEKYENHTLCFVTLDLLHFCHWILRK